MVPPGAFIIAHNSEIKMKTLKSIGLIVMTCVPLHAQWVKVQSAAVPHTSDGKPNLSAQAARMTDGKPDWSGDCKANGKYVQNLAADLKADEVRFQTWAAAL